MFLCHQSEPFPNLRQGADNNRCEDQPLQLPQGHRLAAGHGQQVSTPGFILNGTFFKRPLQSPVFYQA